MAEWIIEANDTEEAAEGKFALIRELVRCKDCKYYVTLCVYNIEHIYVRKPYDYCSRGERIEDD